jgi:hypothetical protein
MVEPKRQRSCLIDRGMLLVRNLSVFDQIDIKAQTQGEREIEYLKTCQLEGTKGWNATVHCTRMVWKKYLLYPSK